MITDRDVLRKFEDDLIRKETGINHDQSLHLFTSMWKEGVLLGVLPPKDAMEGIDVDFRIARVLNSCLQTPLPSRCVAAKRFNVCFMNFPGCFHGSWDNSSVTDTLNLSTSCARFASPDTWITRFRAASFSSMLMSCESTMISAPLFSTRPDIM